MEIKIVDNYDMLAECYKIRNDVFSVEQGVPSELDKDEFDIIDFRKSIHILTYEDNLPIGTRRLKYISKDTVQLNRVAVSKNYRGKSVGEKMLIFLEKYSKKNGYSYVYVEAQMQAKRFYEKCGYSSLNREPFLEAGIFHVAMKKLLWLIVVTLK